MIDLDILVSAKRTDLTKIFPGYSREQLRDMRTRELRRRAGERYRAQVKTSECNDSAWIRNARQGSQRLLEALQRTGLAA